MDRNRYESDTSYREGYLEGELERVALATANSELRSDLRECRQHLRLAYMGQQG